LIIDYADLMAIDPKNLRIDTGRLCKELRGLAVEYNLALITASQANRVGDGVKILTRNHLAEDYSKVAIADNLITLNQTKEEYQMGLMRLYVDKGRNDRHGDQILLAQNYDMGQFCLDSVRINQDYWPMMEDYAQEFGE
jgi:replicative DNA helicase